MKTKFLQRINNIKKEEIKKKKVFDLIKNGRERSN